LLTRTRPPPDEEGWYPFDPQGGVQGDHQLPTQDAHRANLLNRNFYTATLDTVWVSDITYIRTGQGWMRLAIVKDLCTKKVVGYALSSRIDTDLVLGALRMAIRRQKPAPGLIFHSDRGVQYASARFRSALLGAGFRQSMSRKGDPYDNAVAENFFSCLKCERLHLVQFATFDQAADAVFAYIEAFYNTVRPHSGCGWLAPVPFEKSCFTQIPA
ncbi:IS3 family transposase, partial [Eubacteriales bacterium OttesenSCG-928-A19]|nr:IS3 family transposase [Eubacteriales bacterium OttesenSCG-928-A19]